MEEKKKGKRALGKCSWCGGTRKTLYEKRWKRWIAVAHYCPTCGAVEWVRKYEPIARTSREFEEFWAKHTEELKKTCARCAEKCENCEYKKYCDRVLDEMLKENHWPTNPGSS
jgi:hypothetical protein